MALARIGALDCDTNYNNLYPAFMADPAGTFLYGGRNPSITGSPRGLIAKIATSTFTQVAGLDITAMTVGGFFPGVIDTAGAFMYIPSSGSSQDLYKINLSTFTVTTSLPYGGKELKAIAIDNTG